MAHPLHPLDRRRFLLAAGLTAVAAAVPSVPIAAVGGAAPSGRHPARVAGSSGAREATDWVRALYDAVWAEGLTPPAAARFYHACSVAMYESTRAPRSERATLAGQVRGLAAVTKPVGIVDPVVAMSAAVESVAHGLLPSALATTHDLLAARHAAVVAGAHRDRHSRVIDRSERHGRQVALHILDWMAADGYAAASTMPYVPPTGPGRWRSTPPNFGTAIEPHWSLVRPAVLATPDEIAPVPPITYDAEPGSPFHQQAMATYEQSHRNTADQVAIARFWTDNPRLSGLPSGHWFLVLAQLVDETLRLDLDEAVEAFALLGIALHDAFTNCWTWKYRFNLIRPVSYVRDHIDAGWSTLVNTPQFPEYTSGHSVGSGAAEVVLTALFGDVAFVDSTGLHRGLAPRAFDSFTHAAEEAAQSRLYGGIHYPMGIEFGVSQGREVGRLVLDRVATR